jgi:ferric-dicitrate binding protein FerR (iron transport regulator)
MIGLCPLFALARDTQAYMVYARGIVWVNGHLMPAPSEAVFPGDSVETRGESLANISAVGWSIVLQPNSLIKVDAGSITLERGSLTLKTVSVVTSNVVSVRAGQVSITPVSVNETEFEVTDSNGRVRILVRRSDVYVDCGSDSARIAEGEEITRDESGHCKRKAGAYVAGGGNRLESPWVWGGILTGGGLCAWLCPGGSVSPWHP